jgi:transcriptional regulator with XRE-family HTH domain
MKLPDRNTLFIEATLALGGQEALGDVLGVSRRTISRWTAGRRSLTDAELIALARALHLKRPELAAQLATVAGTTLVGAGIVPPPPAPAAPPTPAAPPPDPRHQVESVLCAAAEALDASPRAMRPALLAAFERAIAMHLDLSTLTAGLHAAAPTAKAAKQKA